MTRSISILGSTGSIGRQALQVIEHLEPAYRVEALTAGSNWRLLEEQVRRFKPALAVLSDEQAARELRARVKDVAGCRVESGAAGQLAAACLPAADTVLVALVGFSGLEPTLAALEEGKRVALANKESLVVGGELLQRRGLLGPRILPVDSEHSAIWQCFQGESRERVARIWLTASGGPFREWEAQRLETVMPREALAHPNWRMGPKITIDSATLMNKGLEAMEARWLFGVSLSCIEVVIHPQSIVHSMVEFSDGAIMAQLGVPDMRLPIQYALTYPERGPRLVEPLRLFGQNWVFLPPDREKFPCLDLAYQAGNRGGTAPACLNAANEAAVELFLQGKIGFTRIPALIEKVLAGHTVVDEPELDDLVTADRWAREKVMSYIM